LFVVERGGFLGNDSGTVHYELSGS
jgi:hypothetical protein